MSDVKDPPVVGRQRSGRNDDIRRQRLLSHMRQAPPPGLENMDPRMRRRMQVETEKWEQRQNTSAPQRPVPPVPPQKDPGYETRKQELERKQKAVSEIAKKEREQFIESTIADLPDPECIETIRGILAEHEQSKAGEAAVFKDYMFLEDLSRVPEEKRKKDFAAIIDTIEKVGDRCEQLDLALAQVRSLDLTPEQEKIVNAASRLKGLLTEHIPEEFWRERSTLPKRREMLLASPEERKKTLEKEKAGFPEGKDFAARFKEIIEPHSTKNFERTSVYFDRFVSSPPPEKLNELAMMTKQIIDKAYRIRDAGGKLADVEEMMKSTGLPEEWWPPNFIMALQAWRKCEREVLRRNVQKMCEEKNYDFSSPSDVIKFVKDQAVETGSNAKKMFADMLETGEIKKAVGEFTDKLKNNFGMGDEVADALEKNEFSTLDPKIAAQLLDNIVAAETKLSTALSDGVSALKQVQKLPENISKVQGVIGDKAPAITGLLTDHSADIAEVAHLAASFVPGLALAAAGLKLALALAELAKQSAMLGFASAAMQESIGRVARGELEDGFALTYALQNEQKARGIAVGKATVSTTTAGLNVVGAAAEVGGLHFGVAAKYGLMVTGKVITYGSQVVFTNIEWAQAKSAKELLAEARAGNPVARIEIFKNSATYAKLYVAILAREQDPTALAYVEKNGIDETTIANKANAIWILEAALRAESGQKADDEVADGWLDANTGGAISKIKKVGAVIGSAGGALKDKVHDLRKGDDRGKPYDKDWRYTGSADISASTWRSAKDLAYGAGLHDDHGTGASAAVEAAEKDLKAANDLLDSGNAKNDPAKTRKIALQAIDSLRSLQSALCQWTPMSNKDDNDRQEIHAGMTEFMIRLRTEATRQEAALEKKLIDLGLKDLNFQASISSEPLDDKVWAANWKGAVEKACLPESDGGMEKALKAAMGCIRKRDSIDRNKDPQDWRKACLELKDALDEVIVAVETVRRVVDPVASMKSAVESILAAAAKRTRDMDGEMAGKWPGMPKDMPKEVTAKDWDEFYESACAGGGAKRGKGGAISSALKTLEDKDKTIEKKADNPQKQLAAELDYRDATGKLSLAVAEFLRGQREAADPLKEYVLAIGAYARDQQVTKANTQEARAFTPRPNLTVEAWEETYDNAVEAGAVLANGKIKSGISKALAAYLKAQVELDKLRTAKAYKKIPAAAQEVKTKLGLLAAETAKASGDRGFRDNKIMSQYLAQRLQRLRNLLNDATLNGDAAGKAAPIGAFKPVSPAWTTKGWDQAKKDARELGIIPEKPDTGMTPPLEAAIKAFDEFRKAKQNAKTDKQKLKDLQTAAISKVTVLKAFAENTLEKLSKHDDWVAYAQAWSRLCEKTIASNELKID